ncbi:hypothetical protein [Corynebacterium diphtheriae]|uniref:hypothetical protein n=1 Tax=Corynebacterium diphtheriae TaxID=1717 RepID=UPI001FD4E86B|nr:hypothetical protein [Corynebacterium diphtheriae]
MHGNPMWMRGYWLVIWKLRPWIRATEALLLSAGFPVENGVIMVGQAGYQLIYDAQAQESVGVQPRFTT